MFHVNLFWQLKLVLTLTHSLIMMAWETNINYDISQSISMLGRPFILMILYRIIMSYREKTFQNCFSFQFCHNEDLPLPSQCLVPKRYFSVSHPLQSSPERFSSPGPGSRIAKDHTQQSFLSSHINIANYVYLLSPILIFRGIISEYLYITKARN